MYLHTTEILFKIKPFDTNYFLYINYSKLISILLRDIKYSLLFFFHLFAEPVVMQI